MANIESKIRMSGLQFAIIVIVNCIDYQIIRAPNPIITAANEAGWLSVLLAGVAYLIAALLMVKLAENFPDETFVEYMPRLWGKPIGTVIIAIFITSVSAGFCINLGGFSQVIALFMFDRTPVDVIALSMLMLCIYGTLQDWGTMLRYLQILFVLETTITLFIISLALLNFNAVHVLPLWPSNLHGVFEGVWLSTALYAGYEIVLMAHLFVQRGKVSVKKSVLLAFAYLISVCIYTIVLAVGALSAEGVKNAPYPVFIMIRGVELPGTFIERLENYLLLTWTPVVFDSLALMLFLISHTASRYLGHKDHRPMVLFAAPILFLGAMLLERPQNYELIGQINSILLTGLSFVIIPISLAKVWRQKKGVPGSAQG